MSTLRNTGLINVILIIVFLVLLLSYFNVDIKGFVEDPVTQQNITYVWGGVLIIWNEYLSSPVLYFWNNIFINLLWDSFVTNMERIKAGQPNEFELIGPGPL